MTSWDYYEVGIVKGAGLQVLEAIVQASSQRNTVYRVRYLCCGMESETTHKQIYYRKKRGASHCKYCAGGSGDKEAVTFLGCSSRDHNIMPPTWPVP